MNQLSKLIGYAFKNPSLLKLALTHRSAQSKHNERLEFIGDSIVNLVIGEALYHAYPHETEGELSRWRANLVQRDTLAEVAKTWNLDEFVIIGPGERKTGGHQRPSTLSNTLEAIFGALYFDAGFEQTKQIILNLFSQRLSTPNIQNIHKDNKTLLQEWLQAHHYDLPIYEIIATQGQEHVVIFTVSCTIPQLNLYSEGLGGSKRKAEQDAAQHMLQKLNIVK
jgi:ribonuclease-3